MSADPASVYDGIHDTFQQGYLEVALQKARTAQKDFSRQADWPLKFRLQEAEILIYQGRGLDAQAILNTPNIIWPATGDLAIKRILLLALVDMGHGHLPLADQELREAQTLSDATRSVLSGEVLFTEAQMQLSRNNLTQATVLFHQSAEFAHQHNQLFMEACDLMNLGYIALGQEHYDQAVALLSQASAFAEPIHAHQVTEAALGNAGVAYFYLGDYEKALASFQQAEQQAITLGATSNQVDWKWDEGKLLAAEGRFQEARVPLEESLQKAVAIKQPTEVAGINSELGFIEYQQGHYAAAMPFVNAALKAASLSGDRPTEEEARATQAILAAHTAPPPQAELLLMAIDRDSADEPSVHWAIENALANFYETQHQPEKAADWYRRSIQTFETQRASVHGDDLKLPFFANGDVLYRDYAAFLIASHKPDQALALLDAGRARTLEEGLNPAAKKSALSQTAALNPQSVAKNLNATVLFYSLGPDKSWLWAINEHGAHLFTLPKQSDIDARVQSYQKAILRSSDPLREANPDATALYITLIAPAASMIPHNARVFIIPDGDLNGLNFETLLVPSTNSAVNNAAHYWIEDATLTSASSIRMLAAAKSHPQFTHDPENLLLIGNPVSPSAEYEDLPNASSEISDVENHFPSTERTILTRAQAVPAAYAASRPDHFSYIDFVAHGTASRLSPLDSAVVLSATPGHPDDYKLYARDILHYPLHAKLVMISACYGSGVRAYAGEGLVGLSWAFLRAGSHNVIAALWEENDASAPILSDKLYTELNAGTPPDAALRDAKLSLIHSQSVYRKPFYWGAFQLYAGS